MKTYFTAAFVLFFIPLAILSGCGGDGGQTSSVSAVAASQICIGCHAGKAANISPVTGESITVEWQRSIHKSANGAGCYDCHAQPHAVLACVVCHTDIHKTHPNSCGQCHGGSTNISDCRNCHATVHTGSAKQCLDCHAALGAPHFNSNNSVAGHNAQFVNPQNSNTCINCHNPHDNTVLLAAKAWAKSAHGDVKGPAWTHYDFKAMKDCLRCHTSTGFVDYVTSSPSFTLPTQPLAPSATYGVLGCNACHKNYNFTDHMSVRKIPAYTAPYNGNISPQPFPDVGDSNLCIPCHSGLESNDSIAAITDFTNVSFKNSHYMAAAGLMYLKVGFINFTSLDAVVGTSTYRKTLRPNSTGAGAVPGPDSVVGGVTSKHRRLGTAEMTGAETWITTSGVFDTGGPCVTCHINANVALMPASNRGVNVGGTYNGPGPFYDPAYIPPSKRTADGHSLSAISSDTAQQLCIPCHADEAKLSDPVTAAELKTEEAKPYFNAALAVITQLLKNRYNIEYDSAVHPYFFKGGMTHVATNAVKDWTQGLGSTPDGNKLGKKLMGACYNLNLLTRDPGAYVHARSYSQRLLFDTIDFLDDGLINKSSAATLVAIDPTTFPVASLTDAVGTWMYKPLGLRK